MIRYRSYRIVLLLIVGSMLSCGPRRATVLDVDRIKQEYCEMAVSCVGEPGFDVELCIQRLDEYGIERGGYYDEQGCLDEELGFLECLTGMACEDYYGVEFTKEGGPCYPEMEAVYDADCYPATG